MEQATASGDDGGWGEDAADSSAAPAPATSGDDFAAAGGFGDAPAAKELDKAAAAGGKGWQEEVKKDVPGKTAAPVVPAKKTWAQIAKWVGVTSARKLACMGPRS